MFIARVKIENFRNFAGLDVQLAKNTVVIGENRTGKSNFIHALRLVLDAGLPDTGRQLKFSDIWDGCDLSKSPTVSVDVDFADFEKDPNLLALLTDYRLPADHKIARISYVFRKKRENAGDAKSEADYEFRIFGGGDEARSVRSEVRRRIAFNVLPALRDAESDLASWRNSPLRPLIEDAISQVSQKDLTGLATDMAALTAKLAKLPVISALEKSLRDDIADLAGAAHDIKAKLGFTPSDPVRLFRAIALFIDDGKRGLSEASLGSANLALLALRLAEFAWRGKKNERNYTILAVEEPEAHLHPHLQRRIFDKLFADADETVSLLFTTHSPNIAAVSRLESFVVLRGATTKSEGYALASLPLNESEREDLERYLHATRAELFFARGVLFVEGDSEAALVPLFAKSLGVDLDELGISVCNVGGVNFAPYVRLATALNLPFAVITDWDPVDPKKPLGRERLLKLLDEISKTRGNPVLPAAKRITLSADDNALFKAAASEGLFTNDNTFETEIAKTAGLVDALLSVLEAEKFGSRRQIQITTWKKEKAKIDVDALLAMVSDIGKGRVAGRLAKKAKGFAPPDYIKSAILSLTSRV